jgi:nucleotide-binding universal stress UspA family protein
MKKFLAVFDGYRFSASTVRYAIEVSQKANAHLIGVFLDEFFYHNYNYFQVLTSRRDYEETFKKFDEADSKKREEAVTKFKRACSAAGVNFSIHRDKNIATQELIKESMFADLIVINKAETFANHKQSPPTDFIRELLGKVLCPVLLVPPAYRKTESLTLLYDGRPSSLYAIKMYSYLFGDMIEGKTKVFNVKEGVLDNLRLPENKLMREFMKRHFPRAEFTVVKGDAEECIVDGLRDAGQMVVLGAYQRSEVSRFFRKSMADVLMKEVQLPLFIAHSR